MKSRSFVVISHVVATLCAVSLTAAAADKYQPPRTGDGKPDLQGVWTNATITTLTRPARFKSLVLDPKDVEKETNANPQVVRQKDDDKQDANTAFNGSDLNRGRGYNAFWIDPGMTFNSVRGEYRTSFVIDPPDGQIPFKGDARRMRFENNDESAPAARTGSFDGPEARPLGERCIINSGSAGPPMMTYLYNNNYEFVQTATHFIIRAEMNNYARVVRIGGEHIPKNIRPLHGDSIGHWEGDTLVVETTNFHPFHANGMIGLSDQAKVTERFTRYSKDQVVYQFTVDDPTRYKQPWTGEYSFNATKDHVYEYACHEGNYALTGTLQGAREQEKRAAGKNN
ncbi:MAG TPA: hypothetical protein VET48_07625 [Steroidobacteraceae bacterium]|nr:hypothetical protein [Steroidobacteraceae bacterium]